MSAVLAELAERDAAGSHAAIYAELRDTLGVPMVNLVFRHMATVPGCLEWAWARLAPLYRGGAIHEAGARMATLARSNIGFRQTGVIGIRPEAVADTLSAYIRANPINMIGLGVLTRLLDGRPAAPVTLPPGAPAWVRPIARILPMADLATVPAGSAAKLRALAVLLHGADGPVIPSLFRHFAAWPVALDTIDAVTRALVDEGALEALGRDMAAYGNSIAARLEVPPAAAPDPAAAAAIRHVAELFPANMVKMTVLAIALRDALV